MKKAILSFFSIILLSITLGFSVNAQANNNVQITIPTFKVTLNGNVIDSVNSQYTLIIYSDITYFPMTYNDSRLLGIESTFTTESGLEIVSGAIPSSVYQPYYSNTPNSSTYNASIANFRICVNGRVIDNSIEQYPILLFRDITYFPLTWRFVVDEFGWNYNFDSISGLTISSNTKTKDETNVPYVSSVSPQNAFNQLKSFIICNANDSINGKQMYKEIYERGNALKQYSLDYNPETELITIKIIYRGNYTSYIYIGLTPNNQSHFSMISYYSASNQTNNSDFTGTFYIYPNNYDLNSQISFIKKEGDSSNIETYKMVALMNSLEGLDFTNYIFKTYLNDKNVSLLDFGFNVPATGYTPVDFGNPTTDNSNNYQPGSTYQPSNTYQSGNSYSTNIKITLSSFPLYLYADDGTGTFLGEISSNKYATDSISNEYGKYGSKYQTKSIFNQYGTYGSKYSQYSVFNEYATHPPKILDKNGKIVGYLTANKYIKDAISYEEMMVLLKNFNK